MLLDLLPLIAPLVQVECYLPQVHCVPCRLHGITSDRLLAHVFTFVRGIVAGRGAVFDLSWLQQATMQDMRIVFDELDFERLRITALDVSFQVPYHCTATVHL